MLIVDQVEFNCIIGKLDRILSEFMLLTSDENYKIRDEANTQTIKHHADDLIGVGNKVLENLKTK